MSLDTVPVVVLCGGRGIYIDDSGRRLNKALVRIAGEAMIVHVLRVYLAAGFRRFVLAAGDATAALESLLLDGGAGRRRPDGTLAVTLDGEGAAVRVVDTGADAATGDRLRAVRSDLGAAGRFCVTYSDTLCDIDLREIVAAHRGHGRFATMLATQMPTRFRILGLRQNDTLVRGFLEQPLIENDPINGGFYVFDDAVHGPRYLGGDQPGLVLETTVLERLVADRQLVAHPCRGAWHYLDSERDIPRVTEVAAALRRRAASAAP